MSAYLFQHMSRAKSSSPLKGVKFLNRPTPITASGKESKNWLRTKAMSITSVNNRNLQGAKGIKSINRIGPHNLGQMVMFFYDAKHKDTLPFYDKFPVIFIVEAYKDGFLGINLHYLPPFWRSRLMDGIYSIINNSKNNEHTKTRLTYQLLAASARTRMFGPCVKRYLYSQVRSRLTVIDPDEWDYAAFLPTARFTTDISKVYKDSVSKLKP